jgi:hypothetical protein
MTFFKCAKFFLLGSEGVMSKDGGRIILGDYTIGGMVMLWPVRFCCGGV